MDGVTIKQLEKALACKDDKELRLRVEVLLDILKERVPQPIQPIQRPVQPAQPPKQKRTPQPKSAGAIVGGEQITYSRPPGT